MSEQNKDVVRRLIDQADKGNMGIIDEVVSEDFVEHTPVYGEAPGREGVKQIYKAVNESFPDATTTIEEMIAEGDKVAVRTTLRGTQKGEFMGIRPAGKRVEVEGIDIFAVANGKITAHWGLINQTRMRAQLQA